MVEAASGVVGFLGLCVPHLLLLRRTRGMVGEGQAVGGGASCVVRVAMQGFAGLQVRGSCGCCCQGWGLGGVGHQAASGKEEVTEGWQRTRTHPLTPPLLHTPPL